MNKQEFADWLGTAGLMKETAHRLLLNGDWIKADLGFLAGVVEKWSAERATAAAASAGAAGTIDTPMVPYAAALAAVTTMRGCAATYIEDHAKDGYPGAIGFRPQDVAPVWAEEIQGIDAKAFLDEAVADRAATAPVSAAPEMKCSTCGADRLKERCKAEHWQRCPMAGQAQTAQSAGAPVSTAPDAWITPQVAQNLDRQYRDGFQAGWTACIDGNEEALGAVLNRVKPLADYQEGAPVSAADQAEINAALDRADAEDAARFPVGQKLTTMECPECGTDRLKEPCPRMADECAMRADAHLLTKAAAQTDANSPQTRMDAQSKPLLDAVGKLIKAKGRFHTEQTYKAVVAAYDAAIAAGEWVKRADLTMGQAPVLTEDEIVAVWDGMPGQPGGFLKSFGYLQFAGALWNLFAAKQAGKES